MTAARGAKATYKCKCCRGAFVARVADRNRGWARYCSKSCKAKKQEQRTGQHAAHLNRVATAKNYDLPDRDGHTGEWARYLDTVHPFSDEAFS